MEQEAVRELRAIAKSYYYSATPQVQEQAKKFFRSMDLDRNGRINLEEFLSFMRQEGYKQMRSNSFFNMLDTSGRGTLDFMDVITLYYIIKSGRPFCDSCHRFIPGTFFSCVACFNHPKYSFNVCTYCHLSSNSNYHYHHKHDGRSALFLDNFTLLQATKPPLSTTTTTANQSAHYTAKSQQPRKDVYASTSKYGDMKSMDAQTKPTGRLEIARYEQRPSLSRRGSSASTSTSTSTSKNTDVTRYMTSELYKGLRQSPSVNVSRNESTTSTHNTFRQSRQDQYAIVPATQQVPWTRLASAAFKALDAMIVIGNVVSAVSACTIM